MRFVLTHPSETRPSLVVITCAEINDQEVRRLREDMFGLGCANGLLFDAHNCVILRDSFASMSPDSIVAEGTPVRTDAVLAKAGGGSLDVRVNRWLEMMSANWNSALPLEPATAAPFIMDVVPAASGSMVYATPSAGAPAR
jgi:hypothetical protein